jgi:hypothetical protein
MTTTDDGGELFAIEFAALAREIAMDIFPIEQILELHRLDDEEWQRIQANAKFRQMLGDLTREWNATATTTERVKVKAASGLESTLEVYIRAITDDNIPLAQRVEAGKFLARLGELDGAKNTVGLGGSGVTININTHGAKPPVTIDVTSSPSHSLATLADEAVSDEYA